MGRLYRLRTIATSWGVAVDLTAHFEPGQSLDSVTLSNGVSLEFDEKVAANFNLPPHIKHLEVGIDAFLKAFPEASSQLEGHTILIDDLLYPGLDFQFEGLSCAMAGWLCEEFSKHPVPLFLEYDANQNHYLLRKRNAES